MSQDKFLDLDVKQSIDLTTTYGTRGTCGSPVTTAMPKARGVRR